MDLLPTEISRRHELQALLESLLGSDEVHFQAPANLQMSYPAIRYSRDRAKTEFAGNRPYLYSQGYQVMVLGYNPEDPVLAKIAALPMCTFSRWYAVENLNHNVYNLFY